MYSSECKLYNDMIIFFSDIMARTGYILTDDEYRSVLDQHA